MKLIPLAVALLLITGLQASLAQNSAVPKKPILARAPAFASWTIQFKYKADDKEKSSGSQSDQVQSLKVEKSNKTYHEIITFKSGKTQEKWIYEGFQLMKMSETNSIVPVATPEADAPNPDYADYSHSDFKRFEWVSFESYKGVKTYLDKPAYSFESVSPEGKKLIAYLSVPAQLPLFCSDWETTRLYTYNAAPAAPLVPGADFLSVIATYKRAVEASKYHASPP